MVTAGKDAAISGSKGSKKCRFCFSAIPSASTVCHYCQRDLDPEARAQSARQDLLRSERVKVLAENFKESLREVQRYVTLTLGVSGTALAIVLATLQRGTGPAAPVNIPGVSIGIDPAVAQLVLLVIYTSTAAMAGYIAQNGSAISGHLKEEAPELLEALHTYPSVGTSSIPIVRSLMCFVPVLIFLGALVQIVLSAPVTARPWGGMLIVFVFPFSAGLTLYLSLPVGQNATLLAGQKAHTRPDECEDTGAGA